MFDMLQLVVELGKTQATNKEARPQVREIHFQFQGRTVKVDFGPK